MKRTEEPDAQERASEPLPAKAEAKAPPQPLEPTIEEHLARAQAAAAPNKAPGEKLTPAEVNVLALHNAAQAFHGWALGKRLSRADYESAITKVANLEFQ